MFQGRPCQTLQQLQSKRAPQWFALFGNTEGQQNKPPLLPVIYLLVQWIYRKCVWCLSIIRVHYMSRLHSRGSPQSLIPRKIHHIQFARPPLWQHASAYTMLSGGQNWTICCCSWAVIMNNFIEEAGMAQMEVQDSKWDGTAQDSQYISYYWQLMSFPTGRGTNIEGKFSEKRCFTHVHLLVSLF